MPNDKPRILVVDDEVGLREMLRWSLVEKGFEVEMASNGDEAAQLLGKGKFSLVLTDHAMPELDGLKLLQKVKKTFPEIPVIIMTGFGTVETAVHAMKEGAFDFILKPFDMDYLVRRLQEALSGAAPKSEMA